MKKIFFLFIFGITCLSNSFAVEEDSPMEQLSIANALSITNAITEHLEKLPGWSKLSVTQRASFLAEAGSIAQRMEKSINQRMEKKLKESRNATMGVDLAKIYSEVYEEYAEEVNDFFKKVEFAITAPKNKPLSKEVY